MFFLKKDHSPIDFLICGLGNPDKKYENTRHNAGFMGLDTIAKEYDAEIKKLKFKSMIGKTDIEGHRCLLMKPQTYMNNSGEAVSAAMQFYKIPIDHVIVIFDDISLKPSSLRIRRKGSDGGHNGIKSIIQLTGSDEFSRIKLGIGSKPHPDYDLAAWVLSSFSKQDQLKMKESFDKCPDIVRLITNGKINEAMNKYNS